MIRRLSIRHFKRFKDETFDLESYVVLAGPNNSGKSTLLQAVATWRFALDRWKSQRTGTKAGQRTGVPITRADFTCVPLREMSLLWEDRRLVAIPYEDRRPQFIEIEVEGGSGEDAWTCGLEFQYANPEMVYVRPLRAKQLSKQEIASFPPQGARELDVLYVPALSGIERDEPRRDRGMQDLLVGQGRPGDILRNLMLEVAERHPRDWKTLARHMRELFGLELLEPRYSAVAPFIVCEYREPGVRRPLDLSCAGSGTLQVLLLLSFLYARPTPLVLLDEPDAHQHLILQRQVYDRVLQIARERSAQVLIATHSEVILDATEPHRVFGFLGSSPKLLADENDLVGLQEALKRLSTTDLLLGREVGSVLYVEGECAETILGHWARLLDHRAQEFFERPFVKHLGGRGLREAAAHFRAMQAAIPDIRALCLLDGGDRDAPDPAAAGLAVLQWRRREIENYLLVPEALKRTVGLPLLGEAVEKAFREQVPEETDLHGDQVALAGLTASDEFLVPLLGRLGTGMTKRDLPEIAARMEVAEIHPEAREKLDAIADCLVPAGDR